MSLRSYERQIAPEYLRENQPAKEAWFDTVKAVHQIHAKALYKREYRSVANYLEKRWNKCCTPRCFYRLAGAGGVIYQLEKAGFEDDRLFPSNTRLCLAIRGASRTYELGVKDVWTRLLDKFGSRDNVYSGDVSRFFRSNLDGDDDGDDQSMDIDEEDVRSMPAGTVSEGSVTAIRTQKLGVARVQEPTPTEGRPSKSATLRKKGKMSPAVPHDTESATGPDTPDTVHSETERSGQLHDVNQGDSDSLSNSSDGGYRSSGSRPESDGEYRNGESGGESEEEEDGSGSGSGSECSSQDLDRNSKSHKRGAAQGVLGNRTLQCEWNTSPQLAEKIHAFAQHFGGLSLDPCSNPESPIEAKHIYGRVRSDSTAFIDALKLERWGVPGGGENVHDPNTWSGAADIVFINPPCLRVEPEEGGSNGRESYADRFSERLLKEMQLGHVRAALYLNTVNAYLRKSIRELCSTAITCIFHDRLTFTLSEHDCKKSGRTRGDIRTVTAYALHYLEVPQRTRDDEFVHIFGGMGIIPGYNSGCYSGNLRLPCQMDVDFPNGAFNRTPSDRSTNRSSLIFPTPPPSATRNGMITASEEERGSPSTDPETAFPSLSPQSSQRSELRRSSRKRRRVGNASCRGDISIGQTETGVDDGEDGEDDGSGDGDNGGVDGDDDDDDDEYQAVELSESESEFLGSTEEEEEGE
ncbi:hypothetical protein HK104_005558, partial [Borealophlyctis nickersoniae]